MSKRIGKFHVITDCVLQNRFTHVELTELSIAGGADVIQYRQKSGSTKDMIATALRMKDICSPAGVSFIVNDRLDVALASDADGVHLGQDDFPIPQARSLLGPDKIIGGSAVTLEETQKCFDEGADYVGFGPVYPTSSKEDAGAVTGIKLFQLAAGSVPIPLIAIGGIGLNNIPEVMRAGAKGIAVISAVCCQPDPETAARSLYKALVLPA